ncbi:MAG: hypothetical protein AAF196_14405 [Planctomycetota bacterium]
MIDFLLVLIQLAVLSLCAAALVRPALRRPAALSLAAVAALALLGGVLGGDRELQLSHRYSAYDGKSIAWKAFPTELVTAPGYAFGLVVLAFALPWAVWFLRSAPRPDRPASAATAPVSIVPPLLLAWSGIALVLGLQKTAAPSVLVQPVGFDRVLLPASIAASVSFAYRFRKVLPSILWLSLFVTAVRSPIAIIGTLATKNGLGTTLDVRNVVKIASPLTQQPMKLEPASTEQLGWVLWGPNLLAMPAFYMLSLGGIAFGVTMWITHPATTKSQTT